MVNIYEEALLYAIQRNMTEEAIKLIKLGADVNYKNENKKHSLILACTMGNFEVVKELIENNVDVNSKDLHQENALNWAISSGKLEIVQILLSNKSEIVHPNHSTIDDFLNFWASRLEKHKVIVDHLRGNLAMKSIYGKI